MDAQFCSTDDENLWYSPELSDGSRVMPARRSPESWTEEEMVVIDTDGLRMLGFSFFPSSVLSPAAMRRPLYASLSALTRSSSLSTWL